jgi:2-polyprenyl-6-methoxyphenol hydroxylase-like FAD-dependent oxidoreductase
MAGHGVGAPHAVVIGAGIGGLGAALALARAGHRITLLERDEAPTAASVDEAFAADRRGAPQVRHSHGLAARLHQVLSARFPDVLDDLRAAGVVEHDLGGMLPPDLASELGDVKVLAARRSTYEWVLRRAALASPLVELRVGAAVDGLLVAESREGSSPLPVTGVRLSDGSELAADTVVASTGRRGDVVGWLAAHGIDIPETLTETGITYFSRFYRLRPGRSLAGGILQATSRKAGVNYMCVAADNDTFSITLAIDSNDGELRHHVLDATRFEAVCRLLPGIDTLVDPDLATPLNEVHPMGGLINRLRRFVAEDGRPVVTGFHAVGDAHTTTNPLYGRGCALALVQAALLRDAFDAHPLDPVTRAAAYEAASAREVEPWYHFAIDGDALRSLDDDIDPEDPRFTLRDVMRVGVAEPALLPKTLRTLTLLDTPDSISDDRQFVAALVALRTAHAEKLAARRDQGYVPSLTRDDLLRAGAD